MESRERALERARWLLSEANSRFLLGIFGKPGAGKSTFAQYLVENMPRKQVCILPMDGFHLSNNVLVDLDLRSRKGAPETFDVSGFASLLARTKTTLDRSIFFPVFNRALEESISGEGEITPSTKLVIVEGNYLQFSGPGWDQVAPLLDESWYLQLDESVRMKRLIDRHVSFGKSEGDASIWAREMDERNAVLIESTASKADYLVNLD